MIETEPKPAGASPRGRIKKRAADVVAPELSAADRDWQESEYFGNERVEFVESDGGSALHQLMLEDGDAGAIAERLEELKTEIGATDAMLELSNLYFKLAEQGDSAGDGIMMSRALQEVLAAQDDTITLRSTWHDVCRLRAVRVAQRFIAKGDPRVGGLTYPLDTDDKLAQFDALVDRFGRQLQERGAGFEGFKFRCMGALTEYAAGAALYESSRDAQDQVRVLYPKGKDLRSTNPHVEEGRGVDWVVTIESAERRQVLLIQVKSYAFADQGAVYQPIRTLDDLERALDRLKGRQLVYHNRQQSQDKMDDLIGETRESMRKLLAHAAHGETPVLCVLPSLPINADTDRNADYYSQRDGQPTDLLCRQARDLLAKEGVNY